MSFLSRFRASSRSRKIAVIVGLAMLIIDMGLDLAPRHLSTARKPLSISAREMSPTDIVTDLETGFDAASAIASTALNQAKVNLPSMTTADDKDSPAQVTQTQKDLCMLHKNSDVPLTGHVQMQSYSLLGGGRSYWIKSPACPDEMYSIVWVDEKGRVEKDISCQSTSLTELVLNSGLQYNITGVRDTPNVRAMALSGPGRFLVHCPSIEGLALTRDGKFTVNANGRLVNSEGCIAWTRENGGRAVSFTSDEVLDDKGCSTTTRECMEVLDPDPTDLNAFNFKTKNTLMVLNERALRTTKNTKVLNNAVEELDSPDRSLTGVQDWEKLPTATLPLKCP